MLLQTSATKEDTPVYSVSGANAGDDNEVINDKDNSGCQVMIMIMVSNNNDNDNYVCQTQVLIMIIIIDQ